MQRIQYKSMRVTSSVKRTIFDNSQYGWTLDNRGRGKKPKTLKYNTKHSQKRFHNEHMYDFRVI